MLSGGLVIAGQMDTSISNGVGLSLNVAPDCSMRAASLKQHRPPTGVAGLLEARAVLSFDAGQDAVFRSPAASAPATTTSRSSTHAPGRALFPTTQRPTRPVPHISSRQSRGRQRWAPHQPAASSPLTPSIAPTRWRSRRKRASYRGQRIWVGREQWRHDKALTLTSRRLFRLLPLQHKPSQVLGVALCQSSDYWCGIPIPAITMRGAPWENNSVVQVEPSGPRKPD